MLWMVILGTAYGSGSGYVDDEFRALMESPQNRGEGEYRGNPPKTNERGAYTDQVRNVLSIIKQVQEVLKVTDTVSTSPFSLGRITIETSPEAVKCGGACAAVCSVTRCQIQCGNAIPICFCDADGYAFCGCYAKCASPNLNISLNQTEEKKSEEQRLKVQPMASGIRVFTDQKKPVAVFDVSGRLVYRYSGRGWRFVPLKPGIYFIKSGQLTKKVVVR